MASNKNPINERFSFVFLVAGLLSFGFAFAFMGLGPIMFLDEIPVSTTKEISQIILPEFAQLAEEYPDEFQKYYGEVSPESYEKALLLGRDTYIAEACWHCHSQFVRPVARENVRFGPVSTPLEYQNELQLPQLFGTRRVGPDLIRESGKHSNDWHAAHFYNPPNVVPSSVMPRYTWFYEEREEPNENGITIVPNERGIAVITYVQWLGSWIRQPQETIYNLDAIKPAEEEEEE